ncbi:MULTISPECIES: MFS transporter [Burkholderiaceae]|uniref:Major facilitator superfamily MFS_1 n=1 Tax=Caballeronia sordidicola TaxID=196367 RepID=A0A242MGU1_CABSO|nr:MULTISPECIES: MFS transporter [Burkholderiaceae]AMH42898.1 MFS transporter [Burkholderia sp. PAMC 26561]OTP70523.1 major facilitator superfamily MFS_1 [Caballeronia sordidicola]
MNSSSSSSPSLAPLYWLALGTFAVGTESFMIAGLLPDMAADLHTSIVATGQLVTVFALAYAFSSPVLTALTGAFHRRTLMIAALSAFAVANVLAWGAQNYWELMAARIVLATAAGLYVPGANALAGAIAGPDRRGTALAIVNGGITIAVAFGVPLGAVIGDRLGWRMTFAGVAALSAAASAGLLFGLPRSIGAGLPTATLRERIDTARQPVVLMTLLVTTLWATGAYTIYTYLALFIARTTQLHGAQIGYVLFTWGVAAAVGVFIGGKAVDRLGSRRVIIPCLTVSIFAFALMSASAHWLPASLALVPVLVGVVAWGIAHWCFYPAQQAGLIGIAGLRGTPIALSLNASFMYLGFSLGAALGSLTLSVASVSDLGWVAALCEVGALVLTVSIGRPVVKVRCASTACPA